MDEFLQSPQDASFETIVKVYNTMVPWLRENDPRLSIAQSILEYLRDNNQYKSLYPHIFIALSDIAYHKKDYVKRYEYILQTLTHDPQNETAYNQLIDLIPKIREPMLFLDILETVPPTARLYNVIVMNMYEYASNFKHQQVSEQILTCFPSSIMRTFYENTHNMRFPYTRKDVKQDLDTFLSTIREITANPHEVKEFYRNNPLVLPQKIGFYLTYIPEHTKEIAETLATFFKTILPYICFTSKNATITNINNATRKKRIGILCAFMRVHTIGTMFGNTLKSFDRKKFELYLYQVNNTSDLFAPHVDHLINISHAEEFEENMVSWFKRIEQDDLDIMIYPEIGMDTMAYLYSFARLARTQIVWWGHPESPCTNIDYFISSKYFNDKQEQYNEKLLKMDTLSVVYSRPPGKIDYTVTRQELGLPENGTIYMCTQTPFKYYHDFDDALRMILEKDKEGHLILIDVPSIDYYPISLCKRWKYTMSDDTINRIKFMSCRKTLNELFTFVHHADVMLDTFPFSGSTSHLEQFSIGKVVITMDGKDLRGSLCAGIYRRLGVADAPIANNVEEYVNLAYEYAHDEEKRVRLGQKIKNAMELLYEAEDEKSAWNDLLMTL